ncbi:MAG: hypothetical protein EZS28_014716 [Streblomastix strix]|uniref:Uncharacterized protein n=1 Tax=Streblomastix strix TaxID=222440 RepID=A0A5J4W4V1_9EUKA|nr:MAG: hypothetical protein EZS28_014716 [Streblomastix strix]
MEIDELDDFVTVLGNLTREQLLQDQLLRAAVESDGDYSETKAKRKAVRNVLAQLIGYFNGDVKRNRELASLASAREYATCYPKYGLRVEAEDLDKDKNTPDNTVVYRKSGNIYAVDGFNTAPGFGGKNKRLDKEYQRAEIPCKVTLELEIMQLDVQTEAEIRKLLLITVY